MAHIVHSPRRIEMLQRDGLKAAPSSVKEFPDLKSIEGVHSRSLKGKIVYVISEHYSLLLQRSLDALGVEVCQGNSVDNFVRSQEQVEKADYVILADDVVKSIGLHELEAIRSAAPQVGILAIGPHAPRLVESGWADVAIFRLSRVESVYSALCELGAFQRMAQLERNVAAPRIPVFHQQVKRRRNLFGAAERAELRRAA